MRAFTIAAVLMEVFNVEVDADILIDRKQRVDGVECDFVSHFAGLRDSVVGTDHSDIGTRHRIIEIVLVNVAPDRVLSLNQSVESNRSIGDTGCIRRVALCKSLLISFQKLTLP